MHRSITVPMGVLPTLRRMRAHPTRLVFLIFGRGPRTDAIHHESEAVVAACPSRVVLLRVPDAAVLHQEFPELEALASQGFEVITLSLSFRVAARLRGEEAQRRDALERALRAAVELE